MSRLQCLIATLLEQLGTPTEDGKLIYTDILCMSWVTVCDRSKPQSQERTSEITSVET
jgi:hypothetical protein